MKPRLPALLLIMICLLGGLVVYFESRTEALFLNHWMSDLGVGKLVYFFPYPLIASKIPYWIIYSLPDALWMLALTLVILMIWDFRLNRKSILWVSAALCTGMLYEVAQKFHLVAGTFDILDLILMLNAALLLVFLLFLKAGICHTE